MGVISKSLAQLSSLSNKFFQLSDTDTVPLHALLDPATGDELAFAGIELEIGGPYVASAVGQVFDVDCSGAAALVLGIVGTFTGQAVAVEQTIDGNYWFQCAGKPITGMPSLSAVAPSSNSGSTGTETVWVYELFGKRVRARVTALATGTITFVPALSARPVNLWTSVSGIVAHSSASAGFPVRVAGKTVTGADTTLVSGDVCDLFMTSGGAAIVEPFSPPELGWSYAAASGGIVSTTTAVTIKAAAGSGLRNCISSIQIATDTLGAATEIAIRDGAAGAVLWRGKLQATALPETTISFPKPLRGSANTLLEVVTLTSVTGGVYFNAQGFVAP